ncbi:MAG TPA: hypothetical protein VGH70_06760 [Bradyrhizobium sp.]|jgi:hypothetical protein
MTAIKVLAVSIFLSTMAATPVFAQAAIQEPGLFAFYHPNLDVLNGGAPTPAARLVSQPAAVSQAYTARESGIPAAGVPTARALRHRSDRRYGSG